MGDTQQTTFMDYIARLECDPTTPFAIDLMKCPTSMWVAAEDRRKLFPGHYTRDIIDRGSTFHHTNLMPQQKMAISYAIGYIRYPNARNWQVDNFFDDMDDLEGDDTVFVTKKKSRIRQSQVTSVPEAGRSIQSTKVSSQCQVAPPGAGKTCIAIYIALLAGRNALLITDSRQNEVQLLNSITTHTNIHRFFPVKLVRSNAREDATEKMVDASFITSSAPPPGTLNVLEFGAVHGIVIIDVKMIENLAGASSERLRLRTCLFRTNFDVVVIDEADSVTAEEMRLSFLHGVIGEPTAYDVQYATTSLPTQMRYKLNYNKLVAMSGTWHRADTAGRQFLKSLGPITYWIQSSTLENMNLLAKMTVTLVQCIEPTALVNSYNAEAVTPEKLRICEQLVRLHVAHGQKIMIFSNRYWHLRLLERLFPFALAPTGNTKEEDYAEIEKTFKATVHQAHPLVWITINRGQIGLDVPDTSVVINLVNGGESPAYLRQRMGRASRKKFKYGWFYDLVGVDETSWARGLAGDGAVPLQVLASQARRYRLLLKDGYGTKLIRLTSTELSTRIADHVHTLTLEQDDEYLVVVGAYASLLQQTTVFANRSDLAILDHLVTCAWGSFYHTDKERRDFTLFDTQTQLLSSRWSDVYAVARQASATVARRNKRNSLLPPALRTPIAKPRRQPAATVDKTPVLLTQSEYLANYQMPDILVSNAALRQAVVSILGSNAVGLEVLAGATVSEPARVWTAMMTLRSTVNTMQFECDRQRMVLCRNVLQLGEGVQERCFFLHG